MDGGYELSDNVSRMRVNEPDNLFHILDQMRTYGHYFRPGLSETELCAAEECVGIAFPPDLRTFLSNVEPWGSGFPEWRKPGASSLARALEWPLDGILFDIEHNDFWPTRWGAAPAALADRLALAREHFTELPRLIPIYKHRYLAAEPCLADNPVFSVYQTDVIYYGRNLEHYLKVEFLGRDREPLEGVRHIQFWSDLAEGEDV